VYFNIFTQSQNLVLEGWCSQLCWSIDQFEDGKDYKLAAERIQDYKNRFQTVTAQSPSIVRKL